MREKQRVIVDFTSKEFDHIATDLFQVISFEGTEAISQPFKFSIDLLSAEHDIDLEKLVGKEATFSISRDDATRNIHGVILAMHQGEEAQFDHYHYHAVLVPRISLMNLSRQNQIYQEKTVPDVVAEELLEGDFCGGLVADDLDFRVTRNYPTREYVVQYKETDLNFISRLMEHEGIYYYFEHQNNRDQIVFCDEKNQLDAIIPENRVSYVPASGLASFDSEAIHSFCLQQTQVSSEIILKDFNYRQPHLPLQGNSEVGELGYGRLYDYGDHFKDPAEGDTLARVRAQAELSKQKVCVGKSDAILFEAGKLMEMLDHYRDDLNHEYLITRIHHRGGQALPGVSASSQSNSAIAYMNDFEAIPADIEYRPPLTAIKPKLYGILNATIDGEINSNRAQIDEHGRYKLIMPFDISGNGEGKASRWVRKAEMFGGQGAGMHFPLLKGSEVIWTCIDGDPDRPIITGVVSNPLNKSVVNSENSTTNRIVTPSGIVMEIGDGAGKQEKPNSSTEQQNTRIENSEEQQNNFYSQTTSSELLQQSQQSLNDEGDNPDDSDQDYNLSLSKRFSLYLPDYRMAIDEGLQKTYFRLGAYDTEGNETDTEIGDKNSTHSNLLTAETAMDILSASSREFNLTNSSESGNGLFESNDPARFGIFEYTDGAKLTMNQNGCIDIGNGTSITYDGLGRNDSVIEVVIGATSSDNENQTIKSEHLHYQNGLWYKDAFEKINAHEVTIGKSTELFVGQKEEYIDGPQFSAAVGSNTEFFTGFKHETFMGISSEVKLSYEVELGVTGKYSHVKGGELNVCEGDAETVGRTVTLQVNSVHPNAPTWTNFATVAGGIAGGLIGLGESVTGSALNLSGTSNPLHNLGSDLAPISIQSSAGQTFGAAVGIGGIAAHIAHKIASKAPTPEPSIKMDAMGITLQAGAPGVGASITLKTTGEIEIKGNAIKIDGALTTDIVSKKLTLDGQVKLDLQSKWIKAAATGVLFLEGKSVTTKGTKLDLV
ncbi:type VI secretion system tip protein TssI/VgrG [Alteromonadaceae bacterium BrNp21-10]|nr:type VI secretion system tip protein TssI/VgrG [Alteromonadaceae bacterium BrNp21-10]